MRGLRASHLYSIASGDCKRKKMNVYYHFQLSSSVFLFSQTAGTPSGTCLSRLGRESSTPHYQIYNGINERMLHLIFKLCKKKRS